VNRRQIEFWFNVCRHLVPWTESTTLSRNVGHQSPSDTASHPTRVETSAVPMQKPKYCHRSCSSSLLVLKYLVNALLFIQTFCIIFRKLLKYSLCFPVASSSITSLSRSEKLYGTSCCLPEQLYTIWTSI
jgi:hypothetical protein